MSILTAMNRRQSLACLALAFWGFSLRQAVAATQWVDMGPVSGSVQGHVWSKVVDEVGNTEARNETWQLPFDHDGKVTISIRAPIPGHLDVRIRYTGEYGDPIEHLLSRDEYAAPGGYAHSFGPWSPKGVRDIRIVVSTRDSSTDQIYQLSVSIDGIDTADQPAESQNGPFLGTWKRSENGQLVESIDIVADGQGVTLVFRDPLGAETGRATGEIVDGRLTARNERRLVTITLDGAGINYTSTDHDGGRPWSGAFQR